MVSSRSRKPQRLRTRCGLREYLQWHGAGPGNHIKGLKSSPRQSLLKRLVALDSALLDLQVCSVKDII